MIIHSIPWPCYFTNSCPEDHHFINPLFFGDSPYSYVTFTKSFIIYRWLVVGPPLCKIRVRQLDDDIPHYSQYLEIIQSCSSHHQPVIYHIVSKLIISSTHDFLVILIFELCQFDHVSLTMSFTFIYHIISQPFRPTLPAQPAAAQRLRFQKRRWSKRWSQAMESWPLLQPTFMITCCYPCASW